MKQLGMSKATLKMELRDFTDKVEWKREITELWMRDSDYLQKLGAL